MTVLSPGTLRGQLRSGPSGTAAVMAVLVAAAVLPAPSTAAGTRFQEVPAAVPEHYVGADTYAQGLIVEVGDGGMTLLLEEREDGDLFDPFGAPEGGSSPARSFDSFIGIDSGGLTAVVLARAQGWLFLDDPEGGPQQRIRLDDARDLFQPGGVVQIGRAAGLPSSASHVPVSMQGRTSSGPGGGFQEFRTRKRITIEGWVYVRLNRMQDPDNGNN